MSEEEARLIGPAFAAYQLLIKCKNLGLAMPADALDPDQLDDLYTIYAKVEEVRDNLRNKGAKKNGR